MCVHRTINYDDGPCDIDYECSDYEELADKVEEASKCLQQVLNILYAIEPYDRDWLEQLLDETAGYLGIKAPDSPLAILPNGLHPIK